MISSENSNRDSVHPRYSDLFSTAVLTAMLVNFFAVAMVVSLIIPDRPVSPPFRTTEGLVLTLVFLAVCLVSLRLMRIGSEYTPGHLAFPVFSLFSVVVLVLFVPYRLNHLTALFLFPVVISTLMLGRRGMLAVPVAVVSILGIGFLFRAQFTQWEVADYLVTCSVLVFVAWLLAEATELNRRVNQDLADTSLLLQTVFDALPVGVLAVDRQGRTISANRYLDRLTGSANREAEHNLNTIRTLAAQPEDQVYLGDLSGEQGLPVPVQVSRHPVSFGEEKADVILVQNMTDRQKRRESELLLHRLLAEWNTGVIFLDGKNRIRVHNDAACRYLGLDGNLDGRDGTDILEMHNSYIPQEILKERGAGCELSINDRFLMINRSTWSNAPDGQAWTVLTVNDITAQKKHELELQRVRNLSSLGEIAAGVVHELRNPLTSIKGFTQLAAESRNVEKATSYLTVVLEEISRMQEILNRFLQMAKPSKPAFQDLDLREAVLWIWELIYNDSLSRQVELVKELPSEVLPIRADAQLLRQVVLNLVNNAFEATPAGGRVTISCGGDGDQAYLLVSDTGCGIPPEKVDQIFLPFFTTKESGTGLGLAISNEIIKSHGGSLSVDSSPEGTTFRITLPRANPVG
jgi:signal transduction histidine kinase